ncbi:hypothetical protein LX81_03913 [Palleronia aestuarii]|uniref:Uncharacterized protein n=1 Tax=Palleronia aestuarii TaxID=568105 RepID=A0A2W7MTU2_9RHOB|nr:hypothetical protein [Palleronia aestuarii]PZX11408.1 hypothetical protein LX81_03913 [Palleronia aestuarii]
MSRQDFIIATAIVLFAAFALGWFANWLVHRLTRVSRADLAELNRLTQVTNDAEATRDQAIVYLQKREAEMEHELKQAEADLRDAREEIADLRRHIDHLEGRA